MAVKLLTSIKRYNGLSTDTKPTPEYGSQFFETDTGRIYEYTNAGWTELYQPRTYREGKAQDKQAWIESIFVQTGAGNDWNAEIGTSFIVLNKIYDTVKITGTHTLAVVANKGFTGKTNTMYEVEVTTAGSKTTAKYKWRKQSYLRQTWGAYTTDQTAGAAKTLADGVQVNFNDAGTYAVGDKWRVQACGTWHTPEDGKKSFLTSLMIHLYDASAPPTAKAAKARAWNDIFRVWDLFDFEVSFIDWRTPIYLLGDGTKQFKVQLAEATSSDIEYVYMTMKGWDE